MARSHYIYIVKISGGTVGAYTVKHEMVTACERWVEKGGDACDLAVFRIMDGLRDLDWKCLYEIDIGELLK